MNWKTYLTYALVIIVSLAAYDFVVKPAASKAMGK